VSAIEDLQLALAAKVKVRPFLRRKGGQIEDVAGYLREGLPGIPGGPSPTIRRTPPRPTFSPDEQKMEAYRSKGWSPIGKTRMTKSNQNGSVEVSKVGEKWAVKSESGGPMHSHGEYDSIETAVERAERLLKSRLRVKLLGGLSAEPGPALVHLARRFVGPYKRLSPEGNIVDVEAYWAKLPVELRRAFLEAMHAPATPGKQSSDRPETRPLKDLPPGLRAVYDAVQQQVGARKAAALREKVGDTGRKPGYLSSPLTTKVPSYRPGERVNITDFDGSVRSGTVTADSGYGSYVVNMDGETDVQQVDETAMSPESVDSPDPGRTVGFDDADASWTSQAQSLTYDEAEQRFRTGQWSAPQWEAFQHLWATGAFRYSTVGQPVTRYEDLPMDVKRYVNLVRQAVADEEFARDSLRP
jgi:hypothetical protein